MEPENPESHFPQIAKPDIHDFRSHKMVNGGFAAIGVFRKHRSANSIKSKYPTTVRTIEEIEAEEAEAANVMVVDSSSSSDEEEVQAKKQKNYTIDDIMTLDKSLQITKKQKQSAAASVPAVVQKKSKNIKKVKHAKKSQKIVKFWCVLWLFCL